MKLKKPKRPDAALLPWVALLLLPAVLLPFLFAGIKEKQETPEVSEGISVVEQLEQQDPAEVDRVLRERRSETSQRLLEEGGDETSDRKSVWERFTDYLLLGDSRAVGFSYYDLLDSSRVLADGGLTIRDIPDYLDQVRACNPGYIYLCFGLNDAGIGLWDNGEEYAAEMQERIDQLKQAAPDAKIIISSILPATESATEHSPSWRKIPEFSEAVRALCGSDGVVFADNDAIVEEYMDTLWDEDGVHLQREFYPYWAENLLEAAAAADAARTETENSHG